MSVEITMSSSPKQNEIWKTVELQGERGADRTRQLHLKRDMRNATLFRNIDERKAKGMIRNGFGYSAKFCVQNGGNPCKRRKWSLQYLARQDGQTQSHFLPACLDPLNYKGQMIAETRKEAEILAQDSAKKLTEGTEKVTYADNPVRAAIRTGYRGGHRELIPRITAEEVRLAARDLQKGEAAGPDQIAAGVYRNLPQLHEGLAQL